MIILLAPTLDLARSVTPTPYVTIEAEYGNEVVFGVLYTSAHHGPRGGNPPPCVDALIPQVDQDTVILISHLDLDTVGGIGLTVGRGLPPPLAFAAAEIDVRGPHHLEEAVRGDALVRRQVYAAWAIMKGAPRCPRDVVTDVTRDVVKLLQQLYALEWLDLPEPPQASEWHPVWLSAQQADKEGAALEAATEELNKSSYQERRGAVIVRKVADPKGFVNHLYNPPQGVEGGTAQAVVTLNTATGAVTASMADPVPGVSMATVLQGVFGPAAGGHAGIAGSPRGQPMTEVDLEKTVQAVVAALG